MNKLNIVIPMAGAGSRFAKAGYELPKPLIDVNGKHMIEVVINNLKSLKRNCKFIFVCQQTHIETFDLIEVFKNSCDDFEVVGIDELTEGAACTVLKAESFIDNDIPLMIANSDQWCDFNIDHYLDDIDERDLDGSMLTMKANDPKWSYAKVDDSGYVSEVVEKVVISDEATVGVYNYKKGADFVKYAKSMIESGKKSNGEYYVAPVYTLMSKEGHRIGVFNIGKEASGMYGLGIPNDLELFLSLNICKSATDF